MLQLVVTGAARQVSRNFRFRAKEKLRSCMGWPGRQNLNAHLLACHPSPSSPSSLSPRFVVWSNVCIFVAISAICVDSFLCAGFAEFWWPPFWSSCPSCRRWFHERRSRFFKIKKYWGERKSIGSRETQTDRQIDGLIDREIDKVK